MSLIHIFHILSFTLHISFPQSDDNNNDVITNTYKSRPGRKLINLVNE